VTGLGLLIPLAIILLLGAIAAVAVFVAQRVRAGEPLALPLRSILVGYFHLMSMAAVLLLAVGLATLLKAALSEPLGRSFSYSLPSRELMARPPFGPEAPGAFRPTPEQIEQQYQFVLRQAEEQYRNDLLQGATMLVVGIVLWPLQTWGRRRIGRPGDPAADFFARTQLILLLVLTSLVGIFSLPTGIYEGLRYLLLRTDQVAFQQPPGGSISTALVFVPLWVVYLWAALRRTRAEITTPGPAAA
jgi:hypothetical protein